MAGFKSGEHIVRVKWTYEQLNTNLITFKTMGPKDILITIVGVDFKPSSYPVTY
jgi:hypothetical protein